MRGLAAPFEGFQESFAQRQGWTLPVLSLVLWLLAALALPMLMGRDDGAAPELLVGASVAIPFMVVLFTGKLAQGLSPRVMLLCLALVTSLLLSTLGERPEVASALAIAIVPVYIVTSACFALAPSRKIVGAFRLLAVAALVVLVAAAGLDGDFRFFAGTFLPWERLDGGVHPNYFALTALVGALLAVSHRDPPRLVLIAVFFYLSYLAQSRTTMLCIAACAFYVMAGWTPRILTAVKRAPSLFLPILAAFLTLFGAVGYFVFRLFVGIVRKGEAAGGLSGREELWAKALDLFSIHPVFGHGYRSQYTEDLLGGVYTHNMWLSSLLEIGLFGTFILAGAILYALVAAFRHRRASPVAEMGLLVLVVYLIYGMTEGRYINTGNPLSILFLFSLGYLCYLGAAPSNSRAYGASGKEEGE